MITNIDDLVKITTQILNEFNICDEDVKQDIYLFAIQNANELMKKEEAEIVSSIKNVIIHTLVGADSCDQKCNKTKNNYDQFTLYEIAADAIFNMLRWDYRTAILIKFNLDPAVTYDKYFTRKRVDALSEEGIESLKQWANSIAERDAVIE